MSNVPPPPPGFQLDASPSASAGAPAPPAGFVLDGPRAAAAPGAASAISQSGFGDQLYQGLKNVPLLGAVLQGRDAVASLLPRPQGAPGASPKQRYDAALAAARAKQYPNMTDAQWQAYSGKALAPYNSNDLLQQGGTLGFGDEIGAGVGALGSQLRQAATGQGQNFGDAFNTLSTLEQARRDYGREQQGTLGSVAETVGSLAAGGPASPLTTAVTGLRAALPPIAESAVSGFGNADGDLQNRGWGALTSGALAAGGGALVSGVGRAMNAGERAAAGRAGIEAAAAQAPTAATIKAQAQASYKAATDTGAVMSPSATSIFAHDLRSMAEADGLILPDGSLAEGYSRLGNALKFADSYAGKPMSMLQFQVLHKMVGKVAKSAQGDEAGLGSQMLGHLDGAVEALPKSAFVSGNGERAVDAWVKGQNTWARYKRTQAVETAIGNAQLAAGGFANGLRSEFRQMLKDPAQARYFAASEKAAMTDFVSGGSLQNVLLHLSSGNPLVVEILGHMVAGSGGALTAAVARSAGKHFLRGRADRAAETLAGQVRASVALPNGLQAPALPPQLTPQQLMALRFAGAAGSRAVPQVPDPRTLIPGGVWAQTPPQLPPSRWPQQL